LRRIIWFDILSDGNISCVLFIVFASNHWCGYEQRAIAEGWILHWTETKEGNWPGFIIENTYIMVRHVKYNSQSNKIWCFLLLPGILWTSPWVHDCCKTKLWGESSDSGQMHSWLIRSQSFMFLTHFWCYLHFSLPNFAVRRFC
jgi:hypothetical protein